MPKSNGASHRSPFAVIGLGRMGGNLAHQALEKGWRVIGVDRAAAPEALAKAGLVSAPDIAALRQALPAPRIVFLYVPAGEIVDQVLDQLAETLEPGDIVADGGNSYWGDSVRRHARLAEHGIGFVDLGTSGGIAGARHGAAFMAGGEAAHVEALAPILRDLAVEGGTVHTGGPGSGHFVKLVHNGIEFGMLQAIGEGVDLLEHYPRETLDTGKVLEAWRHGTVIRSWLIDLMARGYQAQHGTAAVPPYVEDTGEVNWLVGDAMRMEVPVPVMAEAVMRLFASRDQRQGWARAIAMMRHGFGGHPYGAEDSVARERRTGRVGGYVGAAAG